MLDKNYQKKTKRGFCFTPNNDEVVSEEKMTKTNYVALSCFIK